MLAFTEGSRTYIFKHLHLEIKAYNFTETKVFESKVISHILFFSHFCYLYINYCLEKENKADDVQRFLYVVVRPPYLHFQLCTVNCSLNILNEKLQK